MCVTVIANGRLSWTSVLQRKWVPRVVLGDTRNSYYSGVIQNGEQSLRTVKQELESALGSGWIWECWESGMKVSQWYFENGFRYLPITNGRESCLTWNCRENCFTRQNLGI